MKTIFVTVSMLLLVSAAPPAEQPARTTCVSDARVAGPVVRADGRLYFRGQPDRRQSWIAGFKGGGRCPFLGAMSAVVIERQGGRYCEGDKVRAINPPTTQPGPVCIMDAPTPTAGDIDD